MDIGAADNTHTHTYSCICVSNNGHISTDRKGHMSEGLQVLSMHSESASVNAGIVRVAQ